MDISNFTKFRIDSILIGRVARAALKEINAPKLDNFSLVFIDGRTIREINKKYRHQDRPTDVLSFEDLNEILICPEIVKKQAGEFNSPFESELMRVLVHGILHLGGFDHEKGRQEAEAMEKKENEILGKLIKN